MVRIIVVTVVAFGAVVFGLQPAKAYEAPWCAVTSGGDDDMHWDCQYRSIEDCRPNVLAGNRGWCNPNPYADSLRIGRQNIGTTASVILARSEAIG
jgi:hypothetical protein